MGRNKNKGLVIENLEILEATANGQSMGKHEERVVFVKGAVPGDFVTAKVYRDKGRYFEASCEEVTTKSDKRIEPVCKHFGVCGGCKWQNMNYESQLFYKQKQVVDNLERLAKVELPEINPIIPSASTEFYRNKLEFTFTNNRWLTFDEIDNGGEDLERRTVGFHVPGKFDKVLKVDKCYLQDELSNDIRNGLRDFALENNLGFFDLREQHGLLRNLVIRTSTTGDVMVIVFFFENKMEEITSVMEYLKATFPDITSLQYGVNEKKNDSPEGVEVIPFNGKDFIEEEMEGLRFKIGPKSFYQTNSKQAYELYKVTRDYAELTGNEVVYDLYTGTGTIANFVAKQAKQVVGVEYVPEAIEDAKVNSINNGLPNTSFFAGDMKDVFTEAFENENGKPDVIITDPPRAGMHQNVIDVLLKIKAPTIVYVSCNPATQARDVELLSELYKVTKVQPVDMFPHTSHVENVVQLKLK